VNEDLVQQVEGARFTPVRLREGYDMGEVDQLLDQLAANLAHHQPVRPLVEAAVFTPVRLREGYDMGEVDDFMDRIVAESERRHSASGDPSPSPSSSADAPAHPASYPVTTSDPPSVIEERPGLMSRLFGRK